ncbi:WXG100 family type VII secretion target [Streptosporangium sp. NPDC051023]|uniref:WXG100 family type VII secretion target n=1 Tax=Streptosporangium sp. NPDC051023 TaxID=3155410 RepID=UPI00344D956A
MNGGDLLRQAEEKELLASRFEGYAENLATLLGRVKTGFAGGGSVWTGLAAQRFDQDAERRRIETNRLAEQCRQAAQNLRNAARRLRSQAGEAGKPF